MKLFRKAKDGGPLSRIVGYWLFEIKSLASAAILKFEDGSRDAFHDHAFEAMSWVLRGKLTEYLVDGTVQEYGPSLRPVFTHRRTMHKVVSDGDTWVLTFRGPWRRTWREFDPNTREYTVLSDGRIAVKKWFAK